MENTAHTPMSSTPKAGAKALCVFDPAGIGIEVWPTCTREEWRADVRGLAAVLRRYDGNLAAFDPNNSRSVMTKDADWKTFWNHLTALRRMAAPDRFHGGFRGEAKDVRHRPYCRLVTIV